jgi:transcription factor IIIB subunit 2
VLEESGVVAEVQFEDTASGGVSALGSFVPSAGLSGLSASARQISGISGTRSTLQKEESREVTLRKAAMKLRRVADQLKLSDFMVEQSLLVYKLALQNEFLRGRNSYVVIGACIYIVCRREKTPHMLLDVAEAVQEDLYYLGRTYMRLVRVLKLKMHVIDPSLYIHRFAGALGLGKKTHLVSMTALRLVARMKRDWIQTGRRPAGICGGCLVISARLHGFRITPSQVAKVVKMHELTIFKRMKEFAETPSSQLTLEEFNKTEITEECDPPSFVRSTATKRPLEISAKPIIQKKQKSKDYSDEEISGEEANENSVDELENIDAADVQLEIEKALGSREMKEIENLDLEHISNSSVKDFESLESQYENSAEKLDSRAIDQSSSDSKTASTTPPVAQVDIDSEESGEDLGSDLDDAEVNNMILEDEATLQLKEKIWNHLNKDYLEEAEERRKLAEVEALKPKRKYVRRAPRAERLFSAESAAEAAGKALASRSKSSKINYDALKALLDESSAGDLTQRSRDSLREESKSESTSKAPAPVVTVEEFEESDDEVDDDEIVDTIQDEVDIDDPRTVLGMRSIADDDDYY